MFCNQCGTANLDEARFCIKCGADLQKQKTPTPPPPDSPDAEAAPPGESVTGIRTDPTLMWPGVSGESRYELLGELGRGGMGIVYKARDRALGRMVALKRMKIANPSRRNMERLLAEAKCLAGLRHFNICQIYDMGRDTNGWYVAMEYLEGGSLSHLVAQRGPLGLEETIRIISPLADALHHAHREGVIHRDVKPQNILFRKSGEPVLTDFGIAKAGGRDFTTTGVGMGSPYFMAPEQASDAKHVDGRADIYSLGGTIYNMLTKKYPIAVDAGQVPPPLRSLVLKCMEQDPAQRYQDCEQLMADLKTAERAAARQAARAHAGAPRRKILAAGAAASLLAIFATAIFFYYSQRARIAPVTIVKEPPKVIVEKKPPAKPPETAPKPALLKLRTSPGAAVTAVPGDGSPAKPLGRADENGLLEASLAAGACDLVISRPDYAGVTNRVTMTAGGTTEARADLAALPARLFVRSPVQGEIWEGTKRLGQTDEMIANLAPGKHKLALKSPGFATAEFERTLQPNENASVSAPALSPLTGALAVSAVMAPRFAAHAAQLPAGAEIRIGPEPWRQVALPFKTNLPVITAHLVQFRAAGYDLPGSSNVNVSADAETAAVFQLTPRPGRVRVLCDTLEARVFENGAELGNANGEFSLEPFVAHTLEVRADGFENGAVTLPAVRPGEACPDQAVTLKQSMASLVIAATAPPTFTGEVRATVVLDGKDLGEQVLPYTAGSLKPGEHTVELRSRDWRSQKPQRVTARPGKAASVTFALSPSPCVLEFLVSPEDAVVSVDGARVTARSIEVEPGRRHRVNVEKPGYRPWSNQVMAETGRTVPVSVSLEKIPEMSEPVIVLPP